ARQRKLARRRRARELHEFRVDERVRQRARRERRRVHRLKTTTAGCHAPASLPKWAELMEKMLDLWDSSIALSRASVPRRFAAILGQSSAFLETAQPSGDAMSRASLDP